MAVLDTVRTTVGTAVETISTIAQTIVEKNRTNAKLNRLRMVMKNESELMNRAYIVLGKEYYEVLKKGEAVPTEKQEKLLEVIDKCKAKIARARECYREIVDNQNEYLYSTPKAAKDFSSEEVVDITVACSNESDYKSSPFSQAEEAVKEKAEDIKEAVAEKVEDVKETVGEVKETVQEKVDDAKETVEEKAEDVKDTVTKTANKAKKVKKNVKKAVQEALDDECPEDELF